MTAIEYLKEIEWMDDRCPVCKRWRTDLHAQWCRLDRAIGVLEKTCERQTDKGDKMMIKLMDYAVSLLLGVTIGVMIMGFWVCNTDNHDVSYYATFENGETVKVDNIIAVPILSVEQIDIIWPEYHAETKIEIEGKEMIFRSKPFLFCDNPEMEGHYAGRDVYCSLVRRR